MKKVRFSNIINIKYYDPKKRIKKHRLFSKLYLIIILIFLYLIYYLCYQFFVSK